MSRELKAEDLYDLRFVSDPRISPAGDRVAAVVTTIVRDAEDKPPRYRSRIHLFAAPPGSSASRVEGETEFTRTSYVDTAPRFSPDGKHLAFLSVREEKKPPQLHVIPLAGGEARRVTEHEAGVREFCWHPDGVRLFYTSRGDVKDEREEKGHPLRVRRMRFRGDGEGFYPGSVPDLHAVDLNGDTRLVREYEEAPAGLVFSPDGAVLYLVRAANEQDNSEFRADAVALDPETGEETVLAHGMRGIEGLAPSPDGRFLAVMSSHRGDLISHTGVFLVDLEERGAPRLISGDLDVSPAEASDSRHGSYPNRPTWTQDEAGEPALLVNAHQDGVTGLGILSLEGRLKRLQAGGQRAVTAFSSTGSRPVAFVSETPTSPGELWFRSESGEETRLTALNDEWCEQFAPAAPGGPFEANDHGVRFWTLAPRKAREDGAVVVEVHGGPHTAYGNGFLFEFQLLASRGFTVVYGNPRGSSGLGHDYAAHVLGDYGGDDASDVLAIVDAAVRRLGRPDAPVHLTGGSYGGFMTNWLVGVTDRFRSAVSQRSISNWTSMYGTSDIGPRFVEHEIGGMPWADLDTLWRQSPIRNAAQVKTPLLLIHSEEDWRCPIEQAEQFFSAIKRLGNAEVELLRFPGEGHELSRSGRPDRRVMRLEAILGWFEAHA